MNSAKVAIVTGGAGGLGIHISHALSEKGFNVVVLDMNEKAMSSLPETYIKIKVDVTNQNEVEEAIAYVHSKCGRIDVLINNAGVIYNEPLINITKPDNMKHSYQSFLKNIDINLNSVFLLSSSVAEVMVKSRTKGVIVNISSISSCGNAGQTAYSAAKAGVNAMTKTWAKELGPLGIRVVAIAPGFIDTESTSHALDESILKHLKKNTPLRKLGHSKNISESILHVIENDFITGTILEVDGGLKI